MDDDIIDDLPSRPDEAGSAPEAERVPADAPGGDRETLAPSGMSPAAALPAAEGHAPGCESWTLDSVRRWRLLAIRDRDRAENRLTAVFRSLAPCFERRVRRARSTFASARRSRPAIS